MAEKGRNESSENEFENAAGRLKIGKSLGINGVTADN